MTTATALKPLLVSAKKAAELLDLDVMTVYELAAAGRLEKRYIGKGTRNFRLTYESLEKYASSLPSTPNLDD